ncbi:MAG: DUF3626 domain-containing protein [Vicinamibacterales bacterium]
MAADSIRDHARVVVHFHPDRIGSESIPVAQALLADGQYRSQFETGLSSGSPTAFPGGERDAWEKVLFGGAYHDDDCSPGERPKYGALELIRFPDGPSPRFGSCYLVLRPEVSQRASFTFAGSEQPDATDRLGTIGAMDGVMAPLLEEIARGEGARVPWPPFLAPTLGVAGLTIAGFLARLRDDLPLPRPNPATEPPGRVLDSCIEAQVHGPIDMATDVETVVADPAFKRTATGEALEGLSAKYAIPLAWHRGFRMAVNDVPAEFRGPAIPELARRIAGRGGMVEAAVIGAAEASFRARPEAWGALGSQDQLLQHFRQLWHVVVRYGSPIIGRE